MVAIRLTRAGTKHRPFYRIVAIDREKPRESRYIDLIGHYNPMSEPAEIKLDMEKYNEWIQKGAKPSQTVRSLLKKVLRSEN
ncbi:MAG TPA: 30S ribosomal protein S16 [Candidatus Aminicenantes bacterium]|nr:30S ribosomal protein S16 [Candidatus Aminicenantes bacterium]